MNQLNVGDSLWKPIGSYRTYASFASQIQLEAIVVPSSWLLLPAASVVPPPSSTSSSPGTGARFDQILTKEPKLSQLCAFSTN